MHKAVGAALMVLRRRLRLPFDCIAVFGFGDHSFVSFHCFVHGLDGFFLILAALLCNVFIADAFAHDDSLRFDGRPIIGVTLVWQYR
jgi:hypothetical protein